MGSLLLFKENTIKNRSSQGSDTKLLTTIVNHFLLTKIKPSKKILIHPGRKKSFLEEKKKTKRLGINLVFPKYTKWKREVYFPFCKLKNKNVVESLLFI